MHKELQEKEKKLLQDVNLTDTFLKLGFEQKEQGTE